MNLTNIIYLTVSSIAVTLIGGILYCVANKIAIIELFSKYPTPMWTIAGTLMGVVIGFLLDQLAYYIVEKRNYRARVQDTIERIKKTMHLSNSRQAIQRIADLTPQFREEEQIKILSEIGFESSLNANTDDVTHCVIEEFRWLVILYETAPLLMKKSRGDKKRIKTIQSALWEILFNIVEYRRSEKLLCEAFDLIDILNKYAVTQGYEKVILSSIRLFVNIGQKSVDLLPDFKFGVNESIKRLCSLKKFLSESKFIKSKVIEYSNTIDETIRLIKSLSEKSFINSKNNP